MQVDPIKPTLKAPGTTRLTPSYDEPPSKLAFKFKLRCYTQAGGDIASILQRAAAEQAVGQCRSTPSNPR